MSKISYLNATNPVLIVSVSCNLTFWLRWANVEHTSHKNSSASSVLLQKYFLGFFWCPGVAKFYQLNTGWHTVVSLAPGEHTYFWWKDLLLYANSLFGLSHVTSYKEVGSYSAAHAWSDLFWLVILILVWLIRRSGTVMWKIFCLRSFDWLIRIVIWWEFDCNKIN